MTFMGQFASKNEFLQTKPCKMGFYILLTPKWWRLWPKTGDDTLCNYPGGPGGQFYFFEIPKIMFSDQKGT